MLSNSAKIVAMAFLTAGHILHIIYRHDALCATAPSSSCSNLASLISRWVLAVSEQHSQLSFFFPFYIFLSFSYFLIPFFLCSLLTRSGLVKVGLGRPKSDCGVRRAKVPKMSYDLTTRKSDWGLGSSKFSTAIVQTKHI